VTWCETVMTKKGRQFFSG